VTKLQPTTDGNLYAAIHQVLEAERARDLSDRRMGQRHAYRCTQLIGPILDDQLPSQSQFRHVQCDDLSCGGMAYLADEVAASDELIVVLGTVPFLFLRARILRHDQIVRSGKIMYRVACRFVGRIDDVPPSESRAFEFVAQ
jgi:hypothetical protein